MDSFIAILFSICFSFPSTFGWDLSTIGINEFSVKHVSLYKSRAFLTIDSVNASLVEASWPENKPGLRPRILSGNTNELSESCEGLTSVIGTDVDPVARLWILDRGDTAANCNPKLIIRSLIIAGSKEIRYDFSASNRVLLSIVVDPIQAMDGDTRAFVTLEDTDYVLFFSLFKRAVGKMKFERKDLSPIKPISLSEVAVNQNQLYISDSLTGRLFSLPIKTIRQLNFPEEGVQKMILKTKVNYLGRLLGRASGLKLDLRDNLYYIIPRDGAVVKWKPGLSLKAENHLVIFQREINVSQVILGVAGKAWIVASQFATEETKRHCLRINA
ncbi:uncharacterized protein LOC129765538 [Toxorhynchites rutilus septentrionalis]|uniref:uncharacterized protein LOC129765538 n=1 Tax=Toxorhynchites rutilus septentrionalis TaxID=329112 RepID=UPI00247959E4|nr:uncharacterized protein LOC129765538 [Toxorhynchites rutilus septentrionalis]